VVTFDSSDGFGLGFGYKLGTTDANQGVSWQPADCIQVCIANGRSNVFLSDALQQVRISERGRRTFSIQLACLRFAYNILYLGFVWGGVQIYL
jgi:hypothetical protein